MFFHRPWFAEARSLRQDIDELRVLLARTQARIANLESDLEAQRTAHRSEIGRLWRKQRVDARAEETETGTEVDEWLKLQSAGGTT